jgi:hypothetical protein
MYERTSMALNITSNLESMIPDPSSKYSTCTEL